MKLIGLKKYRQVIKYLRELVPARKRPNLKNNDCRTESIFLSTFACHKVICMFSLAG